MTLALPLPSRPQVTQLKPLEQHCSVLTPVCFRAQVISIVTAGSATGKGLFFPAGEPIKSSCRCGSESSLKRGSALAEVRAYLLGVVPQVSMATSSRRRTRNDCSTYERETLCHRCSLQRLPGQSPRYSDPAPIESSGAAADMADCAAAREPLWEPHARNLYM